MFVGKQEGCNRQMQAAQIIRVADTNSNQSLVSAQHASCYPDTPIFMYTSV